MSVRLLPYLCLAAVIAFAQRAPAQTDPGSSEDPRSAGEVIELSPFVVDTERDEGYMANNTLAGSRMNTALRDTPATISVFTSEFLEDLGAFRIEEAMVYAVNAEFFEDDDRSAMNSNSIFSDGTSFRVRGLDTTRARNYFPRGRISSESAFTERIEDARGPNSVIFGIGSPGGVINVSTKRANFRRDFRRVSMTVGSYENYRAAVDMNQTMMDGKLAVRMNLVYNDAQSWRHWEMERHKRVHLAAGYRLGDRTQLRVDFERGQVQMNAQTTFNLLDNFSVWDDAGRPTFSQRTVNSALGVAQQGNNTRVEYYSNNDTVYNQQRNPISSMLSTHPRNNVVTDRSIVDYSVGHGGPGSWRTSHFSTASVFLDHQLGENTFFEVAYNYLQHQWWHNHPRGSRSQMIGDPNELNADGTPNPFAGELYLTAQWFRSHRFDQGNHGRAMISHELDLDKWGKYRLGAFGEYQKDFIFNGSFMERWVDAETGEMAFDPDPNNGRNVVNRRTYPTIGDWASYHVSGPTRHGGLLENMFDPVTGRTLNSAWIREGGPREVYSTLASGMIVAQAAYFDNRLIAAGGVRRDEFDELVVGRSRNPDTQIWELDRDDTTENSATGVTRTLGLVYHVTPRISLYANWADNIGLPAPGRQMLHPSGDPTLTAPMVPNQQGKGEDYGIGASLIEDRLYVKATWYRTQGRDQSITSPGAVRTSNERIMDGLLLEGLITQAEHDNRVSNVSDAGTGLFGHESTGVELQATGNLTNDWRITASYAYVDPIEHYRHSEWVRWEEINRQYLSQFDQNTQITEGGRTIASELEEIREALAVQTAAVGVGKLGSRHHKYSMFTRYTFPSGPLQGLYIGGGYRHQSKMFVGRDDDDNNLYGNSFWYADALAGYTLRLGEMPPVRLQLNVYNVFNERDPLILRYDIDNTTVFRERIRPPTTWKLTASFGF